MKKFVLIILVSFIGHCTYAQDDKVTIGNIDHIQSKILNEKREVWVYVPENGMDSQKQYPVLYLLDGDAHFYSVVGMIQQLSQVNGNTICPEMIVVGICNTNRPRDLSPTHVEADPVYKNEYFYKSTGGGENFISFIEKELMPYIEETYPASSYKMLVGHSLGGLTVMHALLNHTHLFNSYICVDPSMWWDNMNYIKATKKALAEKDLTGTTLYVGIANTVEEGVDLKKIQKDTMVETRHLRCILDMDNFIRTQKPKGLRYESKYYAYDTHASVPLITEYDGLRFIFDKYPLKLTRQDKTDVSVDLAKKCSLHYKEVSLLLGYEVKPPQDDMNRMGYWFMQMKQYDKAAGFFKMNVNNYPESYNVYDSYGDYFAAIGDKPQAIENYKKALSIKENPETSRKLNKLLE